MISCSVGVWLLTSPGFIPSKASQTLNRIWGRRHVFSSTVFAGGVLSSLVKLGEVFLFLFKLLLRNKSGNVTSSERRPPLLAAS